MFQVINSNHTFSGFVGCSSSDQFVRPFSLVPGLELGGVQDRPEAIAIVNRRLAPFLCNSYLLVSLGFI
jgi:hypothetical protein